MRRRDILQREEDIRKWIEERRPKSYIAKELDCKAETLNSALKILGIEYGGNQGGLDKKSPVRKTAEEYAKSTHVKSHTLKIKLIEDGLKLHKCECCGGTEWLGQKIPLELDHIDGNHYNNDLENVRLFCPNCHSLTPTNAGKNTKRV